MSQNRVVVTVATDQYLKGQHRLLDRLSYQQQPFRAWTVLPEGCPSHRERPYAFKAYALKQASEHNWIGKSATLLWCDSCILPIRSFEPIWEKIERDGYLIMRNGFSNYEWTNDAAYPELFTWIKNSARPDVDLKQARELNKTIEHVVGGFFGISLAHPSGRAILNQLYHLASSTTAFCGPHTGPIGVKHRHDQTALSVIAWRNECVLTEPPEYFSYPRGEWSRDDPTTGTDERTCAIADGGYF
jgi:hypothetical protein